jgi:glycerol kinase
LAKYIGAIDQGTTSTRFIVFDRSGRAVAIAQKEHQQIYPKPGWVEHDPKEIWQTYARGYRGSHGEGKPPALGAGGDRDH